MSNFNRKRHLYKICINSDLIILYDLDLNNRLLYRRLHKAELNLSVFFLFASLVHQIPPSKILNIYCHEKTLNQMKLTSINSITLCTAPKNSVIQVKF